MNIKPQRHYIISILFILFVVLELGAGKGFAQTHWSGSVAGFTCNNGTANIILDNDVNLTAVITITGGTVNLDLNGHILDRGQGGRVITMTGGTLNITDSSPTTSHMGKIAYTTTGGTYQYPYWKRDANGTIEIKGGIITGGKTSTTSDNGACISLAGKATVTMSGGNLAGNVSYFNGGAVAMQGSSDSNKALFTMNGGSICYNAGVSGGGVIVFQHSTFTMNGGEVSYNHACDWGSHSGGNGGGIFNGGSGSNLAITTINAGSFIGNYAASAGGALLLHCPFYDDSGNYGTNPTDAQISLKMGSTGPVLIKGNHAKWGGGISLDGCTSLCLMNGNVTIEGNEAVENGGGIRCGAYHYSTLPDGVSGFSYKIIRLKIYGGTIINNKAGAGYNGGGIYDNSDYYNLSNRFVTYIDLGSTNALVVKGNTAGDEPNDIYLTYGRSLTALSSDINPQGVGVYTGNTEDEVGLIYSGSGDTVLGPVYSALNAGTTHLFHNNPVYQLKPYSSGSGIFFTKAVSASPWSETQKTVTTSDLHLNNGYYEISSVKELTAFLWHVNGITTHGAFGSGDLSANGKLMADINMSGHYWLPIGEGYTGTFDGNGHTISNLTMARTNPGSERGMFGRLATGSEVKNLQLHGCNFNSGGALYVGCIASKLDGGTISNCVADGTLTTSSTPVVLGGLVGLADNSATIHSSYAMATLTGGTTMGGLVGELASGSLKNSFANTSCINGLVGDNDGTVENCYVRGTTGLVGTGTTPSGCYASTDGTDGDYTAVVKPYTYGLVDNYVRSTTVPLVKTLNNWVDAQGGSTYAHWARPTTTTINGDYPILKMEGFNAVAANSSTLHYGDIDALLTAYNTTSDAIYLYGSRADVDAHASGTSKLYIDEDVAITQEGAITANVGVTLKNTQSSATSWDWHMFSSALTAAPLSVTYPDNSQVAFGVAPTFTFNTSGYLPSIPTSPTNLTGEWDYYCYYEPQYHWINLKRNGNSHWHEDAPNGVHDPITYVSDDGTNVNESELKPGKGYLLAAKRETFLQCEGTLNNANVSIPVTTDGPFRTGYNFVGNPYQSYYDFNDFAIDNKALWGGDETDASYMLLSGNAYTTYAYNASNNKYEAPRWLHPHQGFMIVATTAGTATFDNSKRYIEGRVSFRGEQPNYPLVNLIATDADGKSDITTVELGRPDKGGAVKAYDLHAGHGCLYTHYEDKDYAIAFTQPGLTQVGIRFEADEEATFTMTWDVENGEFGYLHLIDNITGTDTDCLSASEYRFNATPDDYKSRFKLVFDYTGIEENEEGDDPSTGFGTFAFQMGNQLVVNGEGTLQLFDVTGRMMMEHTLYGSQSTTALPDLTAGVYVLLLKGVNGTQTQKIVIER